MNRVTFNLALSKSIRTKYFIATDGATRFRSFQNWILETEITTDVHLLLCLFAFDGLKVKDFTLAIKSKPFRYEASKIGLGWTDENGRQLRIRLGAISLKLLAITDWQHVQELTIKILAEHYVYFGGFDSTLESFSSDQLAWFCEIASGPLAEHLIGNMQMTALSDACYARLISKQALSLNTNIEISEADGVLYQTLEGWLEPNGNDDNPIYIDQIVQNCRRGRIDDRHGYKYQLLQNCQVILQEATDAGTVTSLILSWVVDLILHGTSAQSDIAVSTIVNYTGVLAKPLFKSFRHHDFEAWNVVKFEEAYSSLIFEASPGQRRNMASAINSWHRFLVSWLDVPPIFKRLHDDVPISVPSANVMWEHEFDLIMNWLLNSSMDNRLSLYLRAIFSLAFNIRIRINELLKLRINDLRFFDGFVQIRIRGTKSIAAKRRVEVNINDCKDFMDLVHYRQSEMALLDDYLFADPNRVGRIFKLSKLYTCASYLLKAATGDSTIRFHALSHTLISTRLKNELTGGSASLTNPLHQLATDFGHFSILTSCSEYMHCYEDAIRASIDRDLSHLKISSEIAARWTGKKSATIRKQVSRSSKDKRLIYWQEILAASHEDNANNVCEGLQLFNPTPPKFLCEVLSLGLLKILNFFSDIKKSLPIDIIALRQSLSTEDIRELLLGAKRLLLKSPVSSVDFKYSTEQIIKVIQDTDWLIFDNAFSAKYQSIIKAAQQIYHSGTKGTDAWLLLNKSGYLSLANHVATNDFLELLSMLGLPVTHLAIAHNDEIRPQELRLIQSIFFKNFGSTIPQFTVEKRGGRPKVYLLFSSQRIRASQIPPPAALSISGLNAILFALAVLMELNHEK